MTETKTYFIQSIKGGPIKIGTSKNPIERLKGIQTGCPFKLKIIAIIEGDIEKELHRKFDKYKLNGEWFDCKYEILEYIKKETGKLLIKKRTDPWENIKGTNNFTDRYCDMTYETVEELTMNMRGLKGTPAGEGCLIYNAYEKAKNKNLDNRAEKILNLCECGCNEDCVAFERCDADEKHWSLAMDLLDSCNSVVEGAGVNIYENEIWVKCKPLTSGIREHEYYELLTSAADELDIVGWFLYGNAPNQEGRDIEIVDFFMNVFSKRKAILYGLYDKPSIENS